MFNCNAILLAFITSLATGAIVANCITWLQSPTFSAASSEFTTFIAVAALPFLSGFMHGELLHMCCFFVQYGLMMPTFTIIFGIFSFSNVHDLSWGTRAAPEAASVQQGEITNQIRSTYNASFAEAKVAKKKNNDESSLRVYRTHLFFWYAFANCALIVLARNGDAMGNTFLKCTVLFAAVINVVRFVGSTVYLAYTRVNRARRLCTSSRTESETENDTTAPLLPRAFDSMRIGDRNRGTIIENSRGLRLTARRPQHYGTPPTEAEN